MPPVSLSPRALQGRREEDAMKEHILIIEDDPNIAYHLSALLREEGFAPTAKDCWSQAEPVLAEGGVDLVLLDITLPDANGYSLCTAIKRRWNLPVIFLTALGDESSIVTGFDLGADDYISKPFRPLELVSRIKNVLRRAGKSPALLRCGPLSVDAVQARVWREGEELRLSALEYRLLLIFLSHRGQVLSRSRLLEELWDSGGDYVNDNTLTVYIKRLREKIEADPANPVLLKTVRGLGYQMGDRR